MPPALQDPACLLHGWASAAAVWTPLQPLLPAAATANYAGVTQPADLGAAARAALPPVPALVIGWSLGALLALELALTTPARVRGLFLIGGTPHFVADDRRRGWPAAALARLKARLARDRHAALAAFQAQLFAAGERDAQARHAARFPPGDPGEFTPAGLVAGLDYLAVTDLTAALARVHCPVCWLHGEHDAVCPPGALAGLPPHHQVRLLPGAGHLPFWSQPAAIGEELAQFASRLPATHGN